MFDGDRKEFENVLNKYNEYCALYAQFNNGSTEGVTPFERFYWQYTYVVKYQDPAALWQSGY